MNQKLTSILTGLIISGTIFGCSKSNDKQNNVDKILNSASTPKISKSNSSNPSASSALVNKIMTSAPTESLNKILASEPAKQSSSSPTAGSNSSKINVSLIPTDFAFTFNDGAKHKVTIIGNLENNFIQRFVNNDIVRLKDTTVYLLLVSSNEEEAGKLSQIYCSPNKMAAINTFYSSNQIENQNKNCNKDGLNYTQAYVDNNLGKYILPVLIFEDGTIVNNSMNANAELINQYLSN